MREQTIWTIVIFTLFFGAGWYMVSMTKERTIKCAMAGAEYSILWEHCYEPETGKKVRVKFK